MICQSCRDGVHECKGCDCQHRVREISDAETHSFPGDPDVKAHNA